MSLEINSSMKWSLHFPKNTGEWNEVLYFEQLLFTENDEYQKSTALLEMLQDVFYVTQLDHISGQHIESEIEPNAFISNDIILNHRDDAWDILIGYFDDLLSKIHNNYDLLINDAVSQAKDTLLNLVGVHYADFIRYSMNEVFFFRYEIYSFLKELIPWSLRRKHNLSRCTDIVCDGRAFQNFFNLSLNWIEETQRKIQTYESEDLERLLNYLSRRYHLGKLRNKYLNKKSCGCFSKTLVHEIDNSYTNVLCFSGAEEPKDKLKEDIEKIAKCGYFGKYHLVRISDDIKYHLSETQFITLGEANRSGLYDSGSYGRMFSCCERKTFANYDLNNCRAFRMIVKYAPCILCKQEVKMYVNGRNKRLISGCPTGSIARLDEYNELANKIYKMFHPLLLPYYHITTI